MKQNLGVSVTGGVIKVDGKGRDLNNIAKDLMNFYSANVRAESYTIDESWLTKIFTIQLQEKHLGRIQTSRYEKQRW